MTVSRRRRKQLSVDVTWGIRTSKWKDSEKSVYLGKNDDRVVERQLIKAMPYTRRLPSLAHAEQLPFTFRPIAVDLGEDVRHALGAFEGRRIRYLEMKMWRSGVAGLPERADHLPTRNRLANCH